MTLGYLFNHFDFLPDVLEVREEIIPRKLDTFRFETWEEITNFIWNNQERIVIKWEVGRGDFGDVWLIVTLD